MRFKINLLVILAFMAGVAIAQPPQGPPRPGGGPPPWALKVDTSRNGRIEVEEFRTAADAFFTKFDRNSNGILEREEIPGRPNQGPPQAGREDGPPDGPPQGPPPGGKQDRPMGPPQGPPNGPEQGPNRPGREQEVPHFLFLAPGDANLTKAQFDEKVAARFTVLDANADGGIDWQEIRVVRGPRGPQGPPDNQGMAQFVGAEFRFGDKLVKGAPFSAETVREESKRLFDGSLVKNQTKGLLYRDGEGRVRQEVPFESINGFPVLGRDDEPLRLIHIVDHVTGKAVSLNYSNKTFVDIPFLKASPLTPKDEPQDAKIESLGKQTVEGIAAEGTRTTIEIPVGQIGNDRPVLVVTEKWYSPELQMVIMSKHTDPFAGEVVFKLVNIKRGEPGADLFKVPADFRQVEPRPRQDGPRPQPRKPE